MPPATPRRASRSGPIARRSGPPGVSPWTCPASKRRLAPAAGNARGPLGLQASTAPEQEARNGEDDEDDEEDLGDARGTGGNSAEAEQRRDQSDHEEYDGIVKHVNSWLNATAAG